MERISLKIRRQIQDLEWVSAAEGNALTVYGVPVDSYLTSFAVCGLSNLVKREDIVTSEHLVSFLAVVSEYSQKDWLSSYEMFTSYVVPRSSKKLYEVNEYALYTVTLVRCDADNIRTRSPERGFQNCELEYSLKGQENRKQELGKLMQVQKYMRSALL